MAEIFPDEGLDALMAIVPKNGSNLANLYVGLFTSQTPTTTPTRTMVLATQTGITEATGTAYARQAIAAASWGAPSTSGAGRKITAGQVTFPAVGAGGWGTVNGFFIADALTGGKCIFVANFDDGNSVALLQNDVIKITPSMQMDG
jgi:hypothetical protein